MTREAERAEFLAILLREFPARQEREVLGLARELQRRAGVMARWAERVCSVEMSESEQTAGEARDERNEEQVTALCEPWGIVPLFSGDPRGAVIKLQMPSRRTNDWGQVGVCVPEGN